MNEKIKKLMSILAPVLGTGAVGVCPLCWAASASFLSYIGLGVLIPFWRKIAIAFLLLGLIGFILDYRRHRNIIPLTLLLHWRGNALCGAVYFCGSTQTSYLLWH